MYVIHETLAVEEFMSLKSVKQEFEDFNTGITQLAIFVALFNNFEVDQELLAATELTETTIQRMEDATTEEELIEAIDLAVVIYDDFLDHVYAALEDDYGDFIHMKVTSLAYSLMGLEYLPDIPSEWQGELVGFRPRVLFDAFGIN